MLPSLFLALLFPALFLEGPSLSQTRTDEPTKEWHRGPVHAVLSLKEEEAYRRLKTTEARWRFIEEFWTALDPTPGTPENERRTEFWLRVERADLLFAESDRPGWMTDRGQVYVLLGAPDHLKRFPWGDAWSYEAVPPPDAQPAVGFTFFRAPGGEYSLIPPAKASTDRAPAGLKPSQDYIPPPGERSVSRMPRRNPSQYLCPSGGDPLKRWLPPPPQQKPPPRLAYRARTAPAGNSPFAAQAAAIQEIPGRIRLPAGGSTSEYFFGNLQATPRVLIIQAPGGKTHAVLTLAVPPDQFQEADKPIRIPDLVLAVTIQETVRGQVVARLRQKMTPDPSWSESSGKAMLFQTTIDLPPGTYRAEGTVIDERTHRGSICNVEFSVPAHGAPSPTTGAGPTSGSPRPDAVPPLP